MRRGLGRGARTARWLAGVSVAAVILSAEFDSAAAAGQVLADGETVTASGAIDTGTTAGDPGIGLRAIHGGIIQSFSPLTVITRGANAIGAQALSGSQINIFGGSSIQTSGANGDGLVASGVGSIITATDTSVVLLTSGYGAIAGSGGVISTSGVSIVSPNTGVTALGTGTVTMVSGSVTSTGVNSGAVVANGAAAVISANGTAIYGTAAGTRGVLAVNGGKVDIANASITSTGGGTAVQAFSVAQITLSKSTVTVDGGNALHATAGPNVTITATDTDIVTTGSGSNGALVQSGALVNITEGSTVTTNGPSSHGAVVANGSLNVSDSTVKALGAGSDALRSTSGINEVRIERGTLISAQGAGISAVGGTLNARLSEVSLTGGPIAFQALNSSTLNLAADASKLTGTAVTGELSSLNVSLQGGSTWTVTGDSTVTSLSNGTGSLVQFTASGGGPFKTLTATNYIGAGGAVGLNTYLGADGSPSDRLVINGGTVAGSSILQISNASGPGALTTGNGILVVDATGGLHTGSFSLAGPVLAGPYEYSLVRRDQGCGQGGTSCKSQWALISTYVPVPPDPTPPTPPTPEPPTPTPPSPTPPSPAPEIPNYRREVSLYSALPAMGLLYGRTVIDSLHERIGELRKPDPQAAPNRSFVSGGWARIIGARGNHDGGPGGILRDGPNFDYDIFAFQAGMDLYRGVNEDGSRDHAGIYGAVGRIQGDVRHFNGIRAGTNTIDGYSIGAYWTHFGASGWYLDGVIQGTWFEAEADSRRLVKLKRDGFGFAASIEGGYPVALGGGWIVEPQAQLVYQTLVQNSGHDGLGLVRFSDVDSLAGRVGARLAKDWVLESDGAPRKLAAWMKASLWNEFLGSPKTSFSSATGMIPFRSDLGGAWGEIKIGMDAQIAGNAALYASAGYSIGIDGRSHAYDGRVGVKFTW